MYSLHKTMQSGAAILFGLAIVFIFSVSQAEASTSITDRIQSRICAQLVKASARLSITLPSYCVVTPPPPQTATLTLVKTVVNNNGGTKVAADFQAKINGGNVTWNTAQAVSVGAHTASETTLTGYTASVWGGDCAADGTVTLAAGQNKTCSITNDDQAGTLIVKKVVVNNNNGTLEADDFSFSVNSATAVQFEADSQNDLTVNAGTYTVTEPVIAGYTTTYNNCTNVEVANGETETCTITNDDVAPTPTTATLTLVKSVINNNGGTANASSWTLAADGPSDISGVTGSAAVTNASVTAGVYTLAETGDPTGYAASQYSCVKNAGAPVVANAVTLVAGDVAVCTITNDDQAGTLLVKKVLIQDNGGTAATTTFSFQVDGGVATAFEADGENSLTVNAGTYDVAEVAAAGYTTTYSNCTDVAVANGETETCVITNNDIPPVAQCADGIDNDGDGDIDSPADLGCVGSGDTSEANGLVTALSVTPSTEPVSQEVKPDTANEPLGGFMTNVTGEAINLSSISFMIGTGTAATGLLTNVVLVNESDSVVAGPVNAVWNNGIQTVTFSDVVTFPTGTHTYALKGTIPASAEDGATITVMVAPALAWTNALGATSGDSISFGSVSSFNMNTMTVAVPEPEVNHILISEVYYDVFSPSRGTDSAHEWIELYNPTASAVDLTGWVIADADAEDPIPDGTMIPAGGYIVITATSTLANLWIGVLPENATVIDLEGATVGNGLRNAGDVVFLRNAADVNVDAVSWGDNTTAFSPSVVGVVDSSLVRVVLNTDTDTVADWTTDDSPTPGF